MHHCETWIKNSNLFSISHFASSLISSRSRAMSSRILFTEAHWCSEGLVGFLYKHTGRSPVLVYVATWCKQLKYISASGAESEWHGEACEHGELGRFVSTGQRKKHGILFRDFHSPWGVEQDIIFQQCEARKWEANHRGDKVTMTLLPLAPQRPLSTPEMSALEDLPSVDTQRLAIAHQEDFDDILVINSAGHVMNSYEA